MSKEYEEYKAGDIVQVKKPCTGCVPGHEYILRIKTRNEREIIYANSNHNESERGCSCIENWILVKPYVYIL
jgi:hypothetical protein